MAIDPLVGSLGAYSESATKLPNSYLGLLCQFHQLPAKRHAVLLLPSHDASSTLEASTSQKALPMSPHTCYLCLRSIQSPRGGGRGRPASDFGFWISDLGTSGADCDPPEPPHHFHRKQERHGEADRVEPEQKGAGVGRRARGVTPVGVEGAEDGGRIERLEPVPELVPRGVAGRVERTDGGAEKRGDGEEERHDAGGDDERAAGRLDPE